MDCDLRSVHQINLFSQVSGLSQQQEESKLEQTYSLSPFHQAMLLSWHPEQWVASRVPPFPPPPSLPPHLLPLLFLSLSELFQAPQLFPQGQGQLDVCTAHILCF